MKLIKTTLTGIGQIFLQENGLSGLLITVGMFFSHWTLGVACFLGSLIGTLTAQILKFPEDEIRRGLYGFNASLCFMCTMFTFGIPDASNPLIWLIGLIASVISTLLMRAFVKRGKPAFTFPFVLSCWIFCWGTARFGLFGLSQTTPPLVPADTFGGVAEPFYAWAEVNFGSSIWDGVFLFAAIAVSSPQAAMWGMAATPVGAVLAHYLLGIDDNTLANGLYGFSAILVACVFSGSRLRDFICVMFGILLAVVIQYAVSQTGLAAYTFGFIAASWIMLPFRARLSSYDIDAEIRKLLNP
ncbi:urea transporter [Neisseria chenwenguii]|uniref:Urea transporter n=1 Tax=Neisseria chenwenguii TaxID=1853278 RepID=A0A220RZE2_9NEIS|nr:urea transporter [Neisseria chenwenguii]ASK26543.1 urea transporter [Neisseria chenwenguii]ROV55985.1 urea transporter [Neisseria chenwenguii]